MTPSEPQPAAAPVPSQLAAFYSSAADAYKELWAPQLVKLSQALLEALPLADAQRVLDAGTGVGTLLPEIERRGPRAAAFGVDVAEGMVALAPEGSHVAVMDATHLGFKPGSFDVGLFAFVLFHLPEPGDGLRQMHKALVPGGTLGTITWGDDPTYPAWDVWNEELNAAGADPVGPVLSRHDLVDSEEKVGGLIERAGFAVKRVWMGKYENPMSAEEFLAHRTGHGASRRRFDSLDDAGKKACLEQVRTSLREVPPEGFIDRAEVIYATAVKP